MRHLILALIMPVALLAGPVGDYLGFHVGLVEVREHAGRESLHVTLPVPFDTVFQHAWTDTSTVIAETTLGNSPAWLVRHWNSNNGEVVVDTAWESGDTLMRAKFELLEFTLWANRYRVPFEVGNWWRTGLEGTYYFDLNGDSLEDTLTIWGDTCRVEAIEDAVVPWDTVRDCYRLRTTLRQSLSLRESVLPIRETSYVRAWEWYKDSLGRVRDSSEIEGDGYVWLIIWLPAAQFWASDTGVLLARYTGLAAPDTPAPLARLVAAPNPFREKTTINFQPTARGPEAVTIFDAAGRQVRVLAVSRQPSAVGSVSWDGTDDRGRRAPPGVYLARCGPTTKPVTRLQ
ncbi:hypothetical protein JXB37_01110 [candidate division WOR-3 bacterium]|nr:hypothetical protein [candidate division WOR-3 bacterium]